MASLFANPSRVYQVSKRLVANLVFRRALNVSFEITHSCNANCSHCDKGGPVKEHLASPEEYGRICRELRPVLAQISGGEPLLRKDALEVAHSLRRADRALPVLVVVTNGWLLGPEKYLKFKAAGVDQFSVSLDYPDDRHDENRQIPGLFAHLNQLLPRLAGYGYRDITLNSVIRRGNLHDLLALARKAEEWGVRINFSAYTPLRTGDLTHLISGEKELKELGQVIVELIRLKRQGAPILTSSRVLWRYYCFFRNGSMPHCQAGIRCLVINADGSLCPCAMLFERKYPTQRALIEDFSRGNTCGGCYVSTRANTERSLGELVVDSLETYRQFRRNQRSTC